MEVLDTKRCLFCDTLVQMKHKGGCEWFMNCLCSPSGLYGLEDDSYEPFRQLSYAEKRALFPIISAYIREQSDYGERVVFSFDERHAILESPLIPQTLEEKGRCLLRFLRRHASGPETPVVISQFSQSFNLTYSMNLQELVYIAENLKEDGMLDRIGSTFRLTEKGWQAAESGPFSKTKTYNPCFVLLQGHEEETVREWTKTVFPQLLQLGYTPKLLSSQDLGREQSEWHSIHGMLQQVMKCALLIADVTVPKSETWLYAGYALGNEIPVAWTCHTSAVESQPYDVEPIVWQDANHMALQLLRLFGKESAQAVTAKDDQLVSMVPSGLEVEQSLAYHL